MARNQRTNRPSVAELFELHRRAYGLLMHINKMASDDPAWLGAESLRQISNGRSCERWLCENKTELPDCYLPERQIAKAFAFLFASFFETSFRVDQMEFDDELLDAHLRTRRRRVHGRHHNVRHVVALAVKHVLAREGIRLSIDDASKIANRQDIKIDTRVVAYVWELGRRACGKTKGQVVHHLWRSIPVDIRKSLDEDVYWLAKQRIVETVNASGQ
ncbi:MAG: hypothetical protein GXP29_05465 [Planctomycetes bacterium]|nr:hypothetical protein [Planctomycetota bacterium]